MYEQQISFDLGVGYQAAPPASADIQEEIAAAWGLPLGQRVEICFRGGERSAVTGTLVLRDAPDYPWNPRQPLQLAVAGFLFSSREIERWAKV